VDIFRFYPVFDDIDLYNGILVQGIKSIMWIERYREAGEFTIVANVSSGVKEALPIGSIISHVQSADLMIVENHEISDSKGEDLEVTITGRSFETILEQRVAGANKAFPAGQPQVMTLAADYSWVHAVNLIKSHIDPAFVVDQSDALNKVNTFHYVNNTTGTHVVREIKIGELYSTILDILAEDNLGIAIVRPFEVGSTTTQLVVHDGVDLSSDVVFSFDAGDITNVDYLWSNKNSKNSIMVVSKWAQEMVKSYSGYQRRVTIIDASDIDEQYNDPPDPATLATIQQSLRNRGLQVLKSRNEISLSKAQAAKNAKKYVYRNDFKVGDIVLIDGLFNESAKMRVTEYVEIFDKDGSSQYPTLSTWPEVS
jgi:3'-phosphoadenosine 5'-phosphosulfate sulfotransferase